MAEYKVLANIAAERAVLAGISQYGQDAYTDISELVDLDCFTNEDNKTFYRCISEVLTESKTCDIPSIISTASTIGFDLTADKNKLEYLRSLFSYNIGRENINKNAAIIKKLDIARKAQSVSKQIYIELSQINGTESVDNIVSKIEAPVFEYTMGLNIDSEDRTDKMSVGVDDYVDNLISNPTPIVGIPSPWATYNEAIGGGRRRGGIYLTAARPKAQPLDAKILTPNGWVTMGDIKIGDSVCSPDGSYTKVINVIEQGQQEVFRFTFDDGSSTEACADHNWQVKTQKCNSYTTLSWKEMNRLSRYFSENKDIEWRFPVLSESVKRKFLGIEDYNCEELIVDQGLLSVVSTGVKNTRCITVENTDERYITDDFIITKNCGKSSLAINDALHVSHLGVPVLYLDTEMSKDGQMPRILASLAGISTSEIEKSEFINSSHKVEKVRRSAEKLKCLPFYYRRIAGKPFDEILSIIRRWIVQDVRMSSGRVADCLVIYDYFKLMDTGDLDKLSEHQALGFQIQSLADLCSKYSFPVSAYVQMNRDGITKDSTDIISQSDRLLWLCSSLALLKRKTLEEIMTAGPENGNTKLIVTQDQRYGPGMDEGDWINLAFDKSKCSIKEVGTKNGGLAKSSVNNGFVASDDSEEEFSDEDFDNYDYRDQSYRKD